MAAGLRWGACLLGMQCASPRSPRSQEIPAGFRAPQRSSPRPAQLRLRETLLAPKGRGWRATCPQYPSSALHSGALGLNRSPSLCSEGCGGWGDTRQTWGTRCSATSRPCRCPFMSCPRRPVASVEEHRMSPVDRARAQSPLCRLQIRGFTSGSCILCHGHCDLTPPHRAV